MPNSSKMPAIGDGLSHGIDYLDPYFVVWFFGVPVAYIVLAGLFRALGWWDFKLKVMKKKAGEAKKTLQDSTTRASDDMAFELVAGFCVAYLAGAGFVATYGLFGVKDYEMLLAAPFYGDSLFVRRHLVYPMINYQGWNVVLCLLLEVLGDPSMIAHHIVTGSLAYLGLHPYLHLRGLFFLGIAEVTNIPLTFFDVCKKFESIGKTAASRKARLEFKGEGEGPELQKSALHEASQAIFALSFIVFRLVLWPYHCYFFWSGSVDLIVSGHHGNEQVHSRLVVIYFLVSNVFLTGLQIFWGKQIVEGLLKALGLMGSGKGKASGKKSQ